MQNNRKLAVCIIAALGLLLGLSIGQHHRQYRQIKALEQQLDFPILKFQPEHRFNKAKIILIETDAAKAKRAQIEAQRAEIEAIKESMRAEREVQLKELHQQIEQVRETLKRGK